MVTEMQKNGLPRHQKIKCSFSDGLPEDCQKTTRRQAEDYQKSSRRQAEDWQKTFRRPAEDCQKTTRPSAERSEQKTLSKMQKKQKRPPKSSKNKMSIFGLHSTSDDRLSDLSKKCQPKCKKMKKAPCHKKIKCSILDYVQLLMIGQVIQATKVN